VPEVSVVKNLATVSRCVPAESDPDFCAEECTC
jgi:hypothetical protein